MATNGRPAPAAKTAPAAAKIRGGGGRGAQQRTSAIGHQTPIDGLKRAKLASLAAKLILLALVGSLAAAQTPKNPPPPPPHPIWGQLAKLRAELEPLPGAQVALGSPCLTAAHCGQLGRCNLDNFTCACPSPLHIELNATTCLAPQLLGFQCLIDGQCQRKVAGSECREGLCACQAQFVAHRRDKCLPASKLGDYCLADAQCRLNDPHSHCKWRIQHVYGHCKCPPNYKIIAGRCAPRLGDSCLSSSECQLATADSVCRAPLATDPRSQRATWPTGGQSDLRCLCREGRQVSPDWLACLPGAAREVALGVARDRYELVTAASSNFSSSEPSSQEFELAAAAPVAATSGPPLTSPPTTTTTSSTTSTTTSTTTTTTTSTTTTTTTPPPPPPAEPRSLGAACDSSDQCRASDPNSHCLSNRCECLMPSTNCSAASTGCHRDTFQCRRSGRCISWYFVCDQKRNCDDGSDEEFCWAGPGSPAGAWCPPEAFRCESGGECVGRAKLCDGRRDCPDGSDERGCGGGQTPSNSSATPPSGCPPRAFACRSGLCLPGHVFCNAVRDCPDGSDEDERWCERARRKSAPVVTDSPVFRWERRRLGQLAAAAARIRPRRATTAALQTTATSGPAHAAPAAECPRWAFTCANAKCRSSAILCSGVDGCGDNSDEDRCQVCRCPAPAAAATTAATTATAKQAQLGPHSPPLAALQQRN